MLDECKGERLEEVLSIFSTAVLKKVVQEFGDGHPAIAQQLAMENFSYRGERTILTPLLLAYKNSLRKSLTNKKEIQDKLDDFSSLLKLKDRQVTRRHEQLKASLVEFGNTELVPSYEVKELQQIVQRNWSGSSDWCRALIYGGSDVLDDGVLEQTYERVWKHVEEGRLGDIEDQQKKGLVEQLDARVRDQNTRLAKWQAFEKAILRSSRPARAPKNSSKQKPNSKGLDLGLNVHDSLQLSSAKKDVVVRNPWQPLPEYSKMIETLKDQLANAAKSRGGGHVALAPSATAYMEKEPFEDVSNDEPRGGLRPAQGDECDDSEPNSDQPSPGFEGYTGKSPSQTPPSEAAIDRNVSPVTAPSLSVATSPMIPPPKRPNKQATPENRQIPSNEPVRPQIPPEIKASVESAAADILASMQTTSPSPTKPRHVHSLAERTRLSMSLASASKNRSHHDFDDLPDLPAPSVSKSSSKQFRRSRDLLGSSQDSANFALPAAEGESELSRRTRLSISNMEALTKTAHLERRRSLKTQERANRESFMPKRLETNIEEEEEPGSAVKKLIELGEVEGEVDYESVFMSRPKIKASPPSSPVRDWGTISGNRWDVDSE